MGAPSMTFDQEQEVLPPSGPISQDLEVRVFGSLVTAQRVAVPRNEKKILALLREQAAVNGDNYYYEWETKNRDGTKGLVTGITIKGAMVVVRLFGNCAVDVRAVPFSETHDMFYARFADLETGFSTVRAFKQRRSQNIGMKDKERGEDIIFQIGQSKAIRNVINNALQDFCGDVVEKSRNALIERMEEDGKFADKVVAKLKALMEKHAVSDKMAETYIGRPLNEWLNRHIAKMYVAMKSIDNGDAGVNDVFASDAPGIKTEDKKGSPMQGGGKEADGNQQKSQAGAGSAQRQKRQTRDAAKTDVDDKSADSAGGAGVVSAKKDQPDAPQQEQKAEGPKAGDAETAADQPAEEQAEGKGAASDSTPASSNRQAAPEVRQGAGAATDEPPVDESQDWFTNEE